MSCSASTVVNSSSEINKTPCVFSVRILLFLHLGASTFILSMFIFSPGPTIFPHSLYNFVFPCARVLKMTTMSSAQFIFLVGMTNWNFANLGTLVTEMNKKFFFSGYRRRSSPLLAIECQTKVLLTIYAKWHCSLWSISNIITWYTFVLAIVLRPLYIVDSVLFVITVFDESCVIQIVPVPWHLWLSCHNVTCECYWTSLCDSITSCTSV